jgi:predicted lipoprotein with Yx(FWY)xxD motif
MSADATDGLVRGGGMRKRTLFAALLLLGACGDSRDNKREVAITAPPPPPQTAEAEAGAEPVLVTDANGMTIYYHDKDEPNKSRCNEGCSQYWLPVRPNSAAYTGSSFGVTTRKDGTQQVTFAGKPLYTFFNDKQPGDKKGDGKQGIWHALTY